MQALYKISYVNKLLCIWIYSYILYNILFAFFLVASLSLRKRDRDSGKQENILIGNEASLYTTSSLTRSAQPFFLFFSPATISNRPFSKRHFASYRKCLQSYQLYILSLKNLQHTTKRALAATWKKLEQGIFLYLIFWLNSSMYQLKALHYIVRLSFWCYATYFRQLISVMVTYNLQHIIIALLVLRYKDCED